MTRRSTIRTDKVTMVKRVELQRGLFLLGEVATFDKMLSCVTSGIYGLDMVETSERLMGA